MAYFSRIVGSSSSVLSSPSVLSSLSCTSFLSTSCSSLSSSSRPPSSPFPSSPSEEPQQKQQAQEQEPPTEDVPFRYPIQWDHPDFYDEKKTEAEMRRVFDICHGCRRCFNLCDSFPQLFNLVDSSPTQELDSVPSTKFKKVEENCTLCDLCFMVKCPYVPPHSFNIDFPHLMLRYRAIQNKKANKADKLTEEKSTHKKWLQPLLPVPSSAVAQKAHSDPEVFEDVSTALSKKPTSLIRSTYSNQNFTGPAMSRLAPFFNWIFTNPTPSSATYLRVIIEKLFGIHRMAKIPYISAFHNTYLAHERRRKKGGKELIEKKGEVLLYPCCYGNYNGVDGATALSRVLEHNDIEAKNMYFGCCGMPQFEEGKVKDVANKAANISKMIVKQIENSDSEAVVVPVSSCALMMKKEWPLLLPNDPNVKKVSEMTYDASEYAIHLKKNGKLAPPTQRIKANVVLHHACHNRAQNVGFKSLELIKSIPGIKITSIQRCSGHGGLWGVQEEHFETGMKVGKPVVKQTRKRLAVARVLRTPLFVASDCPFAADHIVQGVEREEGSVCSEMMAVHPIQLLARSYGYIGKLGSLLPPKE